MALNDTDPGDLKLSQAEHDRIFREEIYHDYFPDSQADIAGERPKVLILAGQPGAGKGGLADQAKEEFREKGGAVAIDVDELRKYHPGFDEATKENDRTAAGRVQADAGAWADELRDEAMERKDNVIIIDATLKSPDKAEDLCRKFKEKGYELEIRAMAVRKEDSVQGVYHRYEKKKAGPGNEQRWVDIEKIHDPAYEGVPESIRRIEESGLADRISVYGRDAKKGMPSKLYDSEKPVEGQVDTAERAIWRERRRERTEVELARYHEKNEEIFKMISKRKGLEEKENARFLKDYEETKKFRTDPNRGDQTADGGMVGPASRESDRSDLSTLGDEPHPAADWAALGATEPEELRTRIRSG